MRIRRSTPEPERNLGHKAQDAVPGSWRADSVGLVGDAAPIPDGAVVRFDDSVLGEQAAALAELAVATSTKLGARPISR